MGVWLTGSGIQPATQYMVGFSTDCSLATTTAGSVAEQMLWQQLNNAVLSPFVMINGFFIKGTSGVFNVNGASGRFPLRGSNTFFVVARTDGTVIVARWPQLLEDDDESFVFVIFYCHICRSFFYICNYICNIQHLSVFRLMALVFVIKKTNGYKCKRNLV